jgi:DNA-binding response OmpR family regulator
MKILVAEDDQTTRRMLESVLTKCNYEVITTTDGEETWEKLKHPDAPQIVILDWFMPGMDGVEICRKFRQENVTKPVYIIFLTARGDKKNIIEGLEAGADDYVIKPFDKDELLARINVGRRIVELQNSLIEKEKLQGVIEMAGTVCHEMNQPIQVITGYSELMLLDLPEDNPLYKKIKIIGEQIDKLAIITEKLMRVTKYETKDYLESKIIDIDRASE